MSPGERERALADKPEKQRQYLQLRLREFDALSPTEREIQLRLLHLRYHLTPLLRMPSTNRSELLRGVPASDRPLIEAKLGEWDALTPEARTELLQNEAALRFYPRISAYDPAQQEAALRQFSPERRRKIEEELARLRTFSPEQQLRMSQNFQRFFDLSEPQREKAIKTLPDAKRLQMEAALKKFDRLPPTQRTKRVDALLRFATMSPKEQDRFLEKAARWEAMSPEERRAWREFTAQLPPTPPGMDLEGGPGLPPPLPARANADLRGASGATNP